MDDPVTPNLTEQEMEESVRRVLNPDTIDTSTLLEEEDKLFWTPRYGKDELDPNDDETIAIIRKVYNAQEMAIQDFLKKQKEGKINTQEQVPKQYKQYEKVFSEKASFCFPQERPWDHEIELKPEAISRT
ncbi:hypothetical protein EWM64_g5260 [Hericium alpestre]|uniref:Uncharacterized protein n=1 Tax=Hericium alpestre TaxID=135208 RepID=A0A4Y9ZXV5_9AGAM|nr:hypothetical protein EWM64_g5260 [Hericium alpestre]